jgi:LmbE family N-acetylglucosaminyl deacetylase
VKLFISPHNDDETLFGSFLIQRERPLVLVVFDSYVQFARGTGIMINQRRKETESAMQILGASVKFMSHRDDRPDWCGIRETLQYFGEPEMVYAPCPEPDGHEQHNILGDMCPALFPHVTHYMTYTKAGKSTGVPVKPEPQWITKKLMALSCYESQIGLANTREHFLRDLREYTAK